MKKYRFTATFTIEACDDEKAFLMAYAHDYDYDNIDLIDVLSIENDSQIEADSK